MECAAAEQSVPLAATSPSAQHLLEQGIGLPKGAVANSGWCGGRGWTDGHPPAPPSPEVMAGDLQAPCCCRQGVRAALSCVMEQRVDPLSCTHPCWVSACGGSLRGLLSRLKVPHFAQVEHDPNSSLRRSVLPNVIC